MSSDSQLWQELVERFKFFLMLAALCGCGYIAWNQFIYLVFMLVFGGISATMVPLYNIAQEKLEQLEDIDEVELKNAISILKEAEKIIIDYYPQNPKIENQIINLIEKLYESRKEAGNNYNRAKSKREIIEKEKIKQKNEWNKYVKHKRLQKGLNYGAPPNTDNNCCPRGYPIRATENLTGKNYRHERYRGIYYKPDDRQYNSISASWCFESVENAEADRFRRRNKKKRRKKY